MFFDTRQLWHPGAPLDFFQALGEEIQQTNEAKQKAAWSGSILAGGCCFILKFPTVGNQLIYIYIYTYTYCMNMYIYIYMYIGNFWPYQSVASYQDKDLFICRWILICSIRIQPSMKGWKGKFRQLFPRSEFWKIRAKRLVAVGWIPKAFDFSMAWKRGFLVGKWSLILWKTTGIPTPGPENVEKQAMFCFSLVSPHDWWLRGVLWREKLGAVFVSELIWTSSVSMFGDRCEDQLNWWRTTSYRSEFLTSCAKTAVFFFWGETWHEEVRDALTSLNEKLREVRLMIEMKVSRRHTYKKRFHSIFTADWSSTYYLKMVVSEQ